MRAVAALHIFLTHMPVYVNKIPSFTFPLPVLFCWGGMGESQLCHLDLRKPDHKQENPELMEVRPITWRT